MWGEGETFGGVRWNGGDGRVVVADKIFNFNEQGRDTFLKNPEDRK